MSRLKLPKKTASPTHHGADEDEEDRGDEDEIISLRQEMMGKIREKNKQIENLLAELSQMEAENSDLNRTITELKRELIDATSQINQSADDMNEIQSQFIEIRDLNHSLLKEKEFLMREMDDLRDRVSKMEQEDDLIATRFTEQVDTLISMMGQKDFELKQLREKLDQEKDSWSGMKFDSSREMDLNKLRRKLEEATSQLEEQNLLLSKSQEELQKRDERIEQLEKEVKEMSQELKDSLDELEYVRECAKLKDVDPSFDPNSSKSSQMDQLKILKLQQLLVKLEDEKIALMQEVRRFKSRDPKHHENIPSPDTNVRMELLEKENDELRLGMKEILVGLRESDGRSDIIIDCPSLERVCQYLESRSVSVDLQNVIVLKAELDLLRGHNDQLRTDIKRLRSDRLRLMAFCTEYILGQEGKDEGSTSADLSQGELPPETFVRMEEDFADDLTRSEGEVPPMIHSVQMALGVENYAQTEDGGIKPEEYICNRCPKVLKALDQVMVRLDTMIALKSKQPVTTSHIES